MCCLSAQSGAVNEGKLYGLIIPVVLCPHRALQARLDITLETEADTTELDAELAKQAHSFTGFARQMWAYLTVKQLISER